MRASKPDTVWLIVMPAVTDETLCDNCGAIEKHHGIDTSAKDAITSTTLLMCPLYMKNDRSNWDGNYHKWRKWKPKVPST